MRLERWKFVLSPFLDSFLNSNLEMRIAQQRMRSCLPPLQLWSPAQIFPRFQNRTVNIVTYLKSTFRDLI